jgi:hypothetical protein
MTRLTQLSSLDENALIDEIDVIDEDDEVDLAAGGAA